jgi:hypothetical protein
MPKIAVKCSKSEELLITDLSFERTPVRDYVPCPLCGSAHKVRSKDNYVIVPMQEYERLKLLRSVDASTE